MEKFKVYIDDKEISLKTFIFSGGEVQVKVASNRNWARGSTSKIVAHVRSSDDIMTLMLLNDAIIREYNPRVRRLLMPYLPYARQDRVCASGEALALKVCTDLINSLKFDNVEIWDCHSDVGVALLDNCHNRDQKEVIVASQELIDIIRNPCTVLVSPDAGANKKTLEVAKFFQAHGVIRADKVRDVKTGQITGTEVYGDVESKVCVIVDDICDGGMTFIKLAEALHEKGADRVILYVTHGIFSKGIKAVVDWGICEVYTPNYWPTEESDYVNIIKV